MIRTGKILSNAKNKTSKTKIRNIQNATTTSKVKKKVNIQVILLSISFVLLTIPILFIWVYSNKVCVGELCNDVKKDTIISEANIPSKSKRNEVITSLKTQKKSDNTDAAAANVCISKAPDLSHTNLPMWIQSYFQWHHQIRCVETSKSKSHNTKYLVVVCREKDTKCGGIADRIKPLPFYIYFANLTQRVLLIHWEKPAPAESFLSPSYLNWIVPEWLIPDIQKFSRPHIKFAEMAKRHVNSTSKVLISKYQTWDAGMLYYDEYAGPPTFNEIYHHLFRSIFQPVPKLQNLIDNTMESLHLTPGKYVAAHVRARYPRGLSKDSTVDKEGGFKLLDNKYKHKAIDLITNAIYCAYMLDNNSTIYFASDSNEAVHYILHESAFHSSPYIQVVGQELIDEPLHFDTANYTMYEPEDFFPAFIDLYLIGNSRYVFYLILL